LLFADRDPAVVKNAWNALNELTKKLKKEEMETLVPSTRQVLQSVGVAGHNLPGFALPKGINAVLPIFLQGLMYGTTEQRTQSALAISDIIDRTSGESLRPFVTQVTGPLIRVVSERSVEVKGKPNCLIEGLTQPLTPCSCDLTHPQLFVAKDPNIPQTFPATIAENVCEVIG